ARLGETGLVPEGGRLAEIHGTYSTVLQVMSSALVSPFKEEVWTDAFKELLAGLTHYPDFSRLELDLAQMRGEVSAAASAWYEKARKLLLSSPLPRGEVSGSTAPSRRCSTAARTLAGISRQPQAAAWAIYHSMRCCRLAPRGRGWASCQVRFIR